MTQVAIFIGSASDDLSQEGDGITALFRRYIVIHDSGERILHIGKLMIMSREERFCTDLL